MTLSSIL